MLKIFQRKATRNGTDLFRFWEIKFDYAAGTVSEGGWTSKVTFILLFVTTYYAIHKR